MNINHSRLLPFYLGTSENYLSENYFWSQLASDSGDKAMSELTVMWFDGFRTCTSLLGAIGASQQTLSGVSSEIFPLQQVGRVKM